MASHTNMTATPEVVHAPVVELATLVDHPASSLLVLTNIAAGSSIKGEWS